jgi:DNA-binding CsgD family transcriptional regulator
MSASAPPLVGREAELGVLDRALEAVGGGRSRAVGITGEPGIGKSRLLGELGRRAAALGHLVVAGRAAELERDVPFALWVEALDGHVDGPGAPAEALAGLGVERLADLAVALPAVGRLTGIAPAPTVERHRVARAVRALLEGLGRARPVTVLLDDVHWADPASADVIALLLHRPPEAPALLALAARARRVPGLEDALHAAARNDVAEVMEVGGLSREAAEALLPAAAGPAARARLYRESGGNPFYLQALAGAAAAAPGAPAALGSSGVPRAVVAALVGEVSALRPDARVLVQGAAVAGDPFDPSLAAAAAGMDDDEALEALDAVLAADLVRPTDRPRRFRFRHPLVRRAVYETAGGGWRLAAHARAAAALAARGATPAERARHAERAAHHGDLAAVELLARAAEQTATAAPSTAAGWYAAALRLLPEAAEHEGRRMALLRAQGLALASAGRAVEARDLLRRVLALLPPDAAAERVDLVVRLAELESMWTQGPDEARRLLLDERAALGAAEPRLAAALTLAMAGERSERGDHVATEELAGRALVEARAAGDRVLEAAAAAKAADAAHCRLRGDDPAALAAVDAKLAEATALVDALADGQRATGLRGLVSLGIALVMTGRFESGLAVVERGLALARRTRQGLLAPAFVSLRGFAASELGRLDAAEADEEEALESALLSGNLQVAFWASIQLSWIALARGRADAALDHGRRGWDLLGSAKEYSQAGFTVADARLATGDPQGALAALEVFGWVRPQLWTLDRLKAVDVAVRVLLALGRVEEADEWARRAPAEVGGRRTGVFGAIIARAQASVLLARDRAADAARVALEGAARGEEGHAPLWAARCRTLAGEALAAAGRAKDARAELRRAAAELEARAAWGDRDAALAVLRRLGERPRPTPAAAPGRRDGHGRLAALTPREREVAALVAEGHTNAQIAARLHLSESTVEKHVSSVLGKLGMPSRAGVVRLLAVERAHAG